MNGILNDRLVFPFLTREYELQPVGIAACGLQKDGFAGSFHLNTVQVLLSIGSLPGNYETGIVITQSTFTAGVKFSNATK